VLTLRPDVCTTVITMTNTTPTPTPAEILRTAAVNAMLPPPGDAGFRGFGQMADIYATLTVVLPDGTHGVVTASELLGALDRGTIVWVRQGARTDMFFTGQLRPV
jgi:hypothetical protein